MDYKKATDYYHNIKKLGDQLGAVYFPNVGWIDFSNLNPELDVRNFVRYMYDSYFQPFYQKTGRPVRASQLLEYVHDMLSIEYKKRVEENIGAKFTEIAKTASGNFLASMGYGVQYAVFDVAPELFSPLTLGLSQWLTDKLKKLGIADEFSTAYNWYMTNRARIQLNNNINRRISSLPDDLMEGWINYRGVGGAIRTLGNLVGFIYGYSVLINKVINVLGHRKWAKGFVDLLQTTGQAGFLRNLKAELIGFGLFDTIGATFDPYRTSFMDIVFDIVRGDKIDAYSMKEALLNVFSIVPAATISTSLRYLDKASGIIIKKTPLSKLLKSGVENQVESLISPTEFLARNIISQTFAYPLFVGYESTIRGADYLLSKLYGLHASSMVMPSLWDSMISAGIITGLNLFLTGALYPKYKRHYVELMGEDLRVLEETKPVQVPEETPAPVRVETEKVSIPKTELELTSDFAKIFNQGKEILTELKTAKEKLDEEFRTQTLANLYAQYDVRFPYGRGLATRRDVDLIEVYSKGEFLMQLVGAYNSLLLKGGQENVHRLQSIYNFIKDYVEKLNNEGKVVRLEEGRVIKDLGLPPINIVQIGGIRFEYKEMAETFKNLSDNPDFVRGLIASIDEMIKNLKDMTPYEIYLSDNVMKFKNEIESFLVNPLDWAKKSGFSGKSVNKAVVNDLLFKLNSYFAKVHILENLYNQKGWDKNSRYWIDTDIGIVKVNGQPLYFYVPILKSAMGVELNPVQSLIEQNKVKLLSQLRAQNLDIALDDEFIIMTSKSDIKKFVDKINEFKKQVESLQDLEELIVYGKIVNKVKDSLRRGRQPSEHKESAPIVKRKEEVAKKKVEAVKEEEIETTEVEEQKVEVAEDLRKKIELIQGKYQKALDDIYYLIEEKFKEVKTNREAQDLTNNLTNEIKKLFKKVSSLKNDVVRNYFLQSLQGDLAKIGLRYENLLSSRPDLMSEVWISKFMSDLGEIEQNIKWILGVRETLKEAKQIAGKPEVFEQFLKVRNNLKELVRMAYRDYDLRIERANLNNRLVQLRTEELTKEAQKEIEEIGKRINSISVQISKIANEAREKWYEIKQYSDIWTRKDIDNNLIEWFRKDIEELLEGKGLSDELRKEFKERPENVWSVFFDFLGKITEGTKKMPLPQGHPFLEELVNNVKVGVKLLRKGRKPQYVVVEGDKTNIDYIKEEAYRKIMEKGLDIEERNVEPYIEEVIQSLAYYETLLDMLNYFRRKGLRAEQIVFYPREIVEKLAESSLGVGKFYKIRAEGEDRGILIFEPTKFTSAYGVLKGIPTLDDIVDYIIYKTEGKLFASPEKRVVSLESELELEDDVVKRQIADPNVITEDDILNMIDEYTETQEAGEISQGIVQRYVETTPLDVDELVKSIGALSRELHSAKLIKEQLGEKVSDYVYDFVSNEIKRSYYNARFINEIVKIADDTLDRLEKEGFAGLNKEEREAINYLVDNLAKLFSLRPLDVEELNKKIDERTKTYAGYRSLINRILDNERYRKGFMVFFRKYVDFMYDLGEEIKTHKEEMKVLPPRQRKGFDFDKYTRRFIDLLSRVNFEEFIMKYNFDDYLKFLMGLSNLTMFSPLLFWNDELYREVLKQIFDIDDEVWSS